ncbi:SCO4225 family membrane protein [Streptomyces sp. NPDC050121]|uniref:SCO4225 family membrane protein n=1 Tax=Streptomyces sp. NPDC050121 TaxID=3365601 RepID=UPI00379084B6
MPHAFHPRRLLALATDTWLARGYLAVVAGCVAVMVLFPDSAVAASPLVLTAPLSFLGAVVPFGPGTEGGGAVEAAALGFWAVWLLMCALVNAAVLGALAARSATAAPPAARERPRLHRTRALLAPAVDNWLGRGYLAVVAAALAFFLYAVYVLPDPGFAGIWPLMATAPLGIVALLVSAPAEHSLLTWLGSPLVFAAGTALAGLFNAALLGRLAHRLRARDPRPAV